MSIPLAPKKHCFSQLQEHKDRAKNNNESILSTGDTNANQIMLEVSSSHDEPGTCDLDDEIGNANVNKPQYHSHSKKEPPQPQGFGKGVQAASTSQRDFHPSLAVHRQLSEEHTVKRAILQTPQSVPGPGLASWRNVVGQFSPEVSAKRDAEISRHIPKDKLAKTLDNEELKRAGSSAAAAAAGSLIQENLQPMRLDTSEPQGHVPGCGEGPQGTSAGHTLGTVLSLDEGTSEGKCIHPPKPSTSEARGSILSDTKIEGTHGLDVYNECITHPELTPSSALASKIIPSPGHPEVHLGQGTMELKVECKYLQPRNEQGLMSAQAQGLGCHEEKSMSPVERKELQERAHQEATSQLNSSHYQLGVGEGRGPEGMMGVSAGVEGCEQATPVQSTAPGEGGIRLTGKTSPAAIGRRVRETATRDFAPSDATESNPSEVSRVERRQGSLNGGSAKALASGPSVGGNRAEAPELLGPHSGNPETRKGRETVTPVAEDRNLLENAAQTEVSPAGGGSVFSTPALLGQEITVNLTHHPTPPGSSSQFSVDTGSPSVAMPPTDGGQVLNTSLKVPDKSICPSGIPKPSSHPKDTPSSQEATEKLEMEKMEEKAETKPVLMPKPKHVRPKIITYIRRSPQALGQGDASLVPVGLPYAPPACGMPLPQEEKTANRDLQPSANMYEKFKPDLQKPRVFPSGLMVSGIKPPGHHFSQMSEKFLQEVTDHPGKEEFCSTPYTHYEVPPTFYRSAMLLKPQLGLGAMSRLPSTKSRILIASQRSSASAIHPPGPITTAASFYGSDPSDSPGTGVNRTLWVVIWMLRLEPVSSGRPTSSFNLCTIPPGPVWTLFFLKLFDLSRSHDPQVKKSAGLRYLRDSNAYTWTSFISDFPPQLSDSTAMLKTKLLLSSGLSGKLKTSECSLHKGAGRSLESETSLFCRLTCFCEHCSFEMRVHTIEVTCTFSKNELDFFSKTQQKIHQLHSTLPLSVKNKQTNKQTKPMQNLQRPRLLRLEIRQQLVTYLHVGTGNQTQILYRENPVFLTPEPPLQPPSSLS
ncbi:Mtus2 [Phodopus roborovskii]|uniref:Mtus2 protein n=1 Tax=Phodopus roborovskii TaxID=109678 RepID=A0AAV0A8I3_PHORO|nr:Mtus2 [Phodopus roborovskii]